MALNEIIKGMPLAAEKINENFNEVVRSDVMKFENGIAQVLTTAVYTDLNWETSEVVSGKSFATIKNKRIVFDKAGVYQVVVRVDFQADGVGTRTLETNHMSILINAVSGGFPTILSVSDIVKAGVGEAFVAKASHRKGSNLEVRFARVVIQKVG